MALIPSLSDANTGSSSSAADSASTAADATSDATSATSTSSTSTTPTSTSTSTSTAPASTSPTSSASASSNGSSAGSGSSTSGSSSAGSPSKASPTSTISSTLTAAMTTSVHATVMSTGSDGKVYTTVIETASVLSAGSIVTSTASAEDNEGTSSSNTGEIVGGVIGGVGGLLVILAVLFFILKRQRRKRQLDEAFDGNFDPDRIINTGFISTGARDSMASSSDAGGYAYAGGEKAKNKKATKRASRGMNNLNEGGGTLPDIPLDGDSPMIPHSDSEMQQLMSVGATSRNNLLDEEGMDDDAPATPSPFHNSFSLPHTASSEGHGGIGGAMASPPRSPNGRPLSISASTSLSGHGHLGYGPGPGYSRPPSFYGNNAYSSSPPGSPLPPSSYNGYGGYPIPPGRSPSPGASSAYGISTYPNVPPAQNRRYSNGPDVAVEIGARRYSSGPAFTGQGEGPEEIPPAYDSLNLGNEPRSVQKA
ncbi:hypothetical protein F5890DRAFT_89444 [Lentinula detonsa]|uniref:REJ domain-containing protein n=1 Tax=Lentinula detonsa TaxID=2804962 RepID=A0AA38UY43_9AGAR|nr:hypothetical protein F5890DRAFT_89444 [Lentinula detonsa]